MTMEAGRMLAGVADLILTPRIAGVTQGSDVRVSAGAAIS